MADREQEFDAAGATADHHEAKSFLRTLGQSVHESFPAFEKTVHRLDRQGVNRRAGNITSSRCGACVDGQKIETHRRMIGAQDELVGEVKTGNGALAEPRFRTLAKRSQFNVGFIECVVTGNKPG